MKFEIQTHGTSGKWGYVSPCRVSWCEPEAKSLEEAVEVCRLIKRRGYGVRLIVDGKVSLSAPWQEPVELDHVVEINNK